jgi:hypothetical protein
MTNLSELPNNQPLRFDTHQAADFIGFKPSTLKLSRVTGILAGVNSPTYRKMGRKVVYDRVVLEVWLSQFENQPNTAA